MYFLITSSESSPPGHNKYPYPSFSCLFFFLFLYVSLKLSSVIVANQKGSRVGPSIEPVFPRGPVEALRALRPKASRGMAERTKQAVRFCKSLEPLFHICSTCAVQPVARKTKIDSSLLRQTPLPLFPDSSRCNYCKSAILNSLIYRKVRHGGICQR